MMAFKHFPAEVRGQTHSGRGLSAPNLLQNGEPWPSFKLYAFLRSDSNSGTFCDPGTIEKSGKAVNLPPRSAQTYILGSATAYACVAMASMTWHCIATDPDQVMTGVRYARALHSLRVPDLPFDSALRAIQGLSTFPVACTGVPPMCHARGSMQD